MTVPPSLIATAHGYRYSKHKCTVYNAIFVSVPENIGQDCSYLVLNNPNITLCSLPGPVHTCTKYNTSFLPLGPAVASVQWCDGGALAEEAVSNHAIHNKLAVNVRKKVN